jgi:hypothetical protein
MKTTKKTIPPLKRFERHPSTIKLIEALRTVPEGSRIQLATLAALCDCDPSDANDSAWRGYLATARKMLQREKIEFMATMYFATTRGWLARMTDADKVMTAAEHKRRRAERADRRTLRTLGTVKNVQTLPEGIRARAYCLAAVTRIRLATARDSFDLAAIAAKENDRRKQLERRDQNAARAALDLFR